MSHATPRKTTSSYLPPDLREKVEEAAKKNHRSVSAEIIVRLEQSFLQSTTEQK